MPVTLRCEVCGAAHKRPPSQSHVRTCSPECGYKIRDNGEKPRVKLFCKNCGEAFYEYPSHADRRFYCSRACRFSCEEVRQQRSERIRGEDNPGWNGGITRYSVSRSGKVYRRGRLHKETEKVVRRSRAKEKASPDWADREKMRSVYQEARDRSEREGRTYHVDHIIPLQSDEVCGLHNEFNLQILPAEANLAKGNRLWPDQAA